MRKTRNLTRRYAWNDPIDRQIKGFWLCNFENEVQSSRGDFFRFFLQNLDFKHSLDMKMSLEEEEESKRFKDWVV